jgi:hypothetical protein
MILPVIIFNFTLGSIFIALYFLTIGTMIEKRVINNEVESIIDEFVDSAKVIHPDLKSLLYDRVKDLKPINMEKEDESVRKQNSLLVTKALKIMAVIFAVGMTLTFGLLYIHKLSVKEFLLTNLASFLSVVFIYFIFSNYFASSYKSADPNFIKKTILESLKTLEIPLSS